MTRRGPELYQAKNVDTEAAWQAVMTYFPNASPYYHNLAKQGLVYHFGKEEYDKALKPSLHSSPPSPISTPSALRGWWSPTQT